MRRALVTLILLALLAGAAFAAWSLFVRGDDSAPVTAGPGSTSTSRPSSTSSTAEPVPVVERVSGESRAVDGEGKEHRLEFVLDGLSWRVDDRTTGDFDAYDATSNRYTSVLDKQASVQTGITPGVIDPRVSDLDLGVPLGWLVRGLAESDDPVVTRTTLLGREAWRYESKFEANKLAGDLARDEVRAVVDVASGLPLSVSHLSGGKVVGSITVQNIKVGGVATDPARFAPNPPGATVITNDNGFDKVSPAQAAAKLGGPLQVPASMPPGFASDGVFLSRQPVANGPEGSNPTPGPLAVQIFRRGIERVDIWQIPVGADPQAWSDPFGGEGMSLREEQVRVAGGPADGESASLVTDPQLEPHIWTATRSWLLAVRGSVGKAAMVKALESMKASS